MYFTYITDSIHKYGTPSPHRIYRPKLLGNEGGGGVVEICRIFSGIKSIIHMNSSFASSDVCIWSPKPIVAGKFALML